MFFYEGYQCPVCGKPFKETDDIVTCPKCGAPHHRECWKQEGHCHFAADHDTDRQWRRLDPNSTGTVQGGPPAGKVCPFCGNQNTEFAEFCSRCGKEMPASDWSAANTPPAGQNNTYGSSYGQQPGYQQPPYTPYGQQQPYPPRGYGEYAPYHMPVYDPFGGVPHEEKIEDVPAEDLVTFTGSNSAYYLPRFFKMSRGGSKCMWNWPAFLLTPYWLLYRKNFLSGILVLLFYVAKTLINGFILYQCIYPSIADAAGNVMIADLQQAIMSGEYTLYVWILFLTMLADILLRVLFGCMGNYLYMRTAVGRVKKLSREHKGEFRQALIQAGGVSFTFGAISYAVLTFSNLLINILFI